MRLDGDTILVPLGLGLAPCYCATSYKLEYGPAKRGEKDAFESLILWKLRLKALASFHYERQGVHPFSHDFR